MLLMLFLQAAIPPDIQLGVRLSAERVTIDKQGEASLTVTTAPEGGNLVDVQAPEANGRRTLRNVEVTLDAQARIGSPTLGGEETPSNPPR